MSAAIYFNLDQSKILSGNGSTPLSTTTEILETKIRTQVDLQLYPFPNDKV